MTKVAIVLIIVGILVVLATNLFFDTKEEVIPPPQRDDTTLRQTTSGEVVGSRGKYGARVWRGIPFATPPTGVNRWRAPQPPITTNTVLEATKPGALCPQFTSTLSGAGADTTPGSITGAEDCLYLNIWSPPNAANLPVMVWIHGGGNSIGHGASYNGAALATNRDVVVVTLNYRLGVFGWFKHPALATGDPLDDSGNYGTLDIVRSLQWVHNNIAQFGGDANNVTLFGESAGAFDTLAMMASPLAKNLFHRAIVQSGGFRPASVAHVQDYVEQGGHPNSSQEIVAKLLIADGKVADKEAAKSYLSDWGNSRLREYLYNKPAEAFFAQFDGGGFGMINLPANFSDGHVLPDMTTEEIFSNAENHNVVPTILGTNRDEPALFMVRDPQYVENWLGFLPRLIDEPTYTRIVKYGALAWKERGVDSLANYLSSAGNEHVYAYRFDWDEEPSQAGFDLSVALGAAHGLEISFVFDEFEGGLGLSYLYPNDDAQYALADSMTAYWSEFAYTGNPGKGRDSNDPQWLAWGDNGKRSLILDSPNDQGIFMDDKMVTVDSIKLELAQDSGFTHPEDQCATYVRTFRDAAFDRDQYNSLNPSCAGIDPHTIARF